MLIVMMLALALVTGADDRPWDRARVVDALQKLMKTGEPRHVDHDEGQELWGSLSLLLQSGPDPELEGLAHRAACPIVVRVYRPLDTIDRAGLEVTTRCVLPLRSPVGYRAIVEANPDGGGWRKLAEVRPGGSYGLKLNRGLRREDLSAGFHRLDLRAQITYEQPSAGMPASELRELPPLAIGLQADGPISSRASPAVALAARKGRTVHVNTLEPSLPDEPLSAWLARLGPRVEWRTNWCDLHPSGQRERWRPLAVCEIGSVMADDANLCEVWIRLGELQVESQPFWRELPTTLEAAYIRRTNRTAVPLAQMPTLVAAGEQSWPVPVLTIAADDVKTPPPARGTVAAVPVRVAIANYGQVDAFGITIDVTAGSGELALLRRRFVRDVPAGGRVEIPISVPLQAPYGWVFVATPFGNHSGTLRQDFDQPFKLILINRDAAPEDFVRKVCESAAGRPSC